MSNGLLAKAVSVSGTYVEIYQVPNNLDFMTVNLNILNTAGTDADVEVHVSLSSSPVLVDSLDLATLGSKEVLERNCIILSPGERVFFKSSNSATVARLSGLSQ